MKILPKIICMVLIGCLTSCTSVKLPIHNQYRIEQFSYKKLTHHKTKLSILVSQPEGMAGTQTEQMQYINKPFELKPFSKNAWVSAPANMLYPLMTQSLQKTGYFHAVASGPFIDKADYRLDSQVIALQQNFLVKPSRLEIIVKVLISHIVDNRAVASKVFYEVVPCPTDTPYGGVIAANKATQLLTAHLSRFVVNEIKKDNPPSP